PGDERPRFVSGMSALAASRETRGAIDTRHERSFGWRSRELYRPPGFRGGDFQQHGTRHDPFGRRHRVDYRHPVLARASALETIAVAADTAGAHPGRHAGVGRINFWNHQR